MDDADRTTCLEALATELVRRSCGDTELVVDQRGNQHLVVHALSAGLAWRFPRTSARARRLPESVERHRRVQDIGVPVPDLVAWQAETTSDLGYMVLQRVTGHGLDEPAVRSFRPRAQSRLGSELGVVLTALASFRSDDPGQPAWFDLWSSWAQELTGLMPELIKSRQVLPEQSERWLILANRAVEQARSCTTGLVHGDLGGVNVRVDQTGRIVAVLDWDESFFADLATDVAAVAVGVPPGVWQETARHRPELEDLRRSYTAYLPTWPLQAITWAHAQADQVLLRRALEQSARL